MDHLATSPAAPPSAAAPSHAITEATRGCLDKRAGMWKVNPGRAATLKVTETGLLRIAHGRVWVTFDHAGHDLRVRAGDHFLGRGECLEVFAGQTLVLEPYAQGHAAQAIFQWEPAAVRAPRGVAAGQPGIVQPLLDLRAALGLAAAALGRLARGLWGAPGVAVTGLASGFVADRARGALAARAFSAQSSDKRAQCSMS